jgi:hypothetical protein
MPPPSALLTLLPLLISGVDSPYKVIERPVPRYGKKARKIIPQSTNIVLSQKSYRHNIFTGVHRRPLLKGETTQAGSGAKQLQFRRKKTWPEMYLT